MSIPTSIIPAKPRVRRKRRQSGAAPVPPPVAITVLSVVKGAGNDLTWNFSAAVTLTGAGVNVPELENDMDGTGVWQSPASCAQGAASSIVATYPDAPGEATPWRIAAQPTNVAQGAEITVPQSGAIE